jgi:PAS domain S-box-containing protein
VFSNSPIRRKLMTMILLTSGVVLLLTCAAFLAYEFVTFRQAAVRQLATLGEIIAANSTAAVAFNNPDDARETLAALRAEPHVVAAILYDRSGRPFARYPDSLPAATGPTALAEDGYRFERGHLVGYQPVIQRGNDRLGTLYLEADMGALYERLRLYGSITALVIVASFLAAYLLSGRLQRRISDPIMALAEVAKAVSDRGDYSVRAPRLGRDELGILTDAFNHMLAQIQTQNLALTESEGRVRAVLNSALSAVIVTDAAGAITDWNTRAETMFGLLRAEALGRRLEDTIVSPQSRSAYSDARDQSLGAGPAGVGQMPVEMTALRRDQSEFPVELSVSPLRAGDVLTFCSFITDITERKQAEKKIHAQLARHELLNRITRAIGERQDLSSIFQVVLRSLEDNLPIDFACVCLYDAVQDALTVAGLGLKGQPLAAPLGLGDQTPVPIDQNGLRRAIQGHLVYEPDVRAMASPFSQRLARAGLNGMTVAPLLVESQVFGVLIAARQAPHSFSSPDCEFIRQLAEHVALAAHQAQIYTALQDAYEDLRESQQAVLQQERLSALGQMASGIAHDINNAISPVALYTQSLLEREAGLSANAREYLETINRAMEDVAATVARLREFSRRRDSQAVLGPAAVNSLVQHVLHLTRARWSDMPQQRGVVIETNLELAPDLPPIMAAEGEIREALTNLVFNAVDAMPQGGRLTIRTSVASGGPDGAAGAPHVQVEVIDTGLGMDEETRRRCLEPFYTTKGERGTGLGLAMVYGMVQRHSAEIEIESAVGNGTTVRLSFALPATVATGAPAAGVEARPPLLRILLVDDDPLLLKSLRDTLEADGHRIVTASGGHEGIDLFATARAGGEPVDVVITDLGMPYVDGRQVATAVKHASPSTPVILLTGWGQRLAADGDVPPNVDRLLGKPPKLRELREALAYCAQLSRPQS